MIHYMFPHIEQLRDVLVSLKHKYQNPTQTTDGWVFDETLPLPVVEFYGTVKLHGTNSAIIITSNNIIYCQSRERIITPESDNMGFAKFVENIKPDLFKWFPHNLCEEASLNNLDIEIYGEWCGQGIQKGVGISQLPRMFVIFAVKIGNRWCKPSELYKIEHPYSKIYSIFNGGNPQDSVDKLMFRCVIDFNNINSPNAGTEKFLKDLGKLTQSVEEECPFAKSLGVSGVGEGIVWREVYDINTRELCGDVNGDPLMFKVKGEKHKNVKEHAIVQMDAEKANNLSELVSMVVTEQRLSQGLEKLREKGLDISKKNTGEFLKWITEDITRENSDILDASGLDKKEIFSAIQKESRTWFFTQTGV